MLEEGHSLVLEDTPHCAFVIALLTILLTFLLVLPVADRVGL